MSEPDRQRHESRGIRTLFVVALAAALLAGCGGTPDTGPPEITVRLVVDDGALRPPGGECAGSGPWLYIHRNSSFSIRDPADGTVLASGSLPAGVAEKIFTADTNASREPTRCILSFAVRLAARDRYELVLEKGAPIAFAASQINLEDSTVTLGVQ